MDYSIKENILKLNKVLNEAKVTHDLSYKDYDKISKDYYSDRVYGDDGSKFKKAVFLNKKETEKGQKRIGDRYDRTPNKFDTPNILTKEYKNDNQFSSSINSTMPKGFKLDEVFINDAGVGAVIPRSITLFIDKYTLDFENESRSGIEYKLRSLSKNGYTSNLSDKEFLNNGFSKEVTNNIEKVINVNAKRIAKNLLKNKKLTGMRNVEKMNKEKFPNYETSNKNSKAYPHRALTRRTYFESLNESAGTYYVERIDPNTKWASPKNEGNGIYSQETNKDFSKKGWCKKFFNENDPNNFIALFVWGYYPFIYKNGEYQKVSSEEFKKNVKNYSALEKVAKREYITIADKQANRYGPVTKKENTVIKDALNKAYKEMLPKNIKVTTNIERTKNGTDFPLEILVKFFENGSQVLYKRMAYNKNKKKYETYAGRGTLEISNKDLEDITTKVVKKSGPKIAKHMYLEEVSYFNY